jgi:pSer/pThr/pTyr-binding forkhead associated (FHA) protein
MSDSARRLESAPPASSSIRTRANVRYAIRYRGHDIPLLKNELVIGRSASADIVLESTLVSRMHARLIVADDGPSIEDLGSRNGVLVNGSLVQSRTRLAVGDRVSIGNELFEVAYAPDAAPNSSRMETDGRRAAQTMSFEAVRAELAHEEEEDSDAFTRRADAFELLAGVVDKALAMGRGAEAERLLGTHLATALEDVKRGKALPNNLAPTAARYAVKLAAATSNPRWIDYAVRLYQALGVPLPLPVVDELYGLLRRVRGIDRGLLREYTETLKAKADALTPADRFAVQRIERLDQLSGL